MKQTLLCLLMALMSALPSLAQLIDVKGTVLDDTGEPLIGATVMVKGSSKGTSTDLDGNFAIKDVSPKATLVVTYVGMKKVETQAKPEMTIRMESVSEMLDGIIVTAFGAAKKSSFTGSASVINSDKIEQKQVTNVMQSLMGEVAGLDISPSTAPGSTQSMTIRGAGSINAGTDPLIVVDGMPYEGSWNSINPADVENITVLKDAASSALYGARGANGVILITTKKGSTNNAKVTLDARWGANSRSSQDYDMITDPGQYYEMHYAALYNSYINNGMAPAAAYERANANLCGSSEVGGLGYCVYTVPEGQNLIGTDGRLNPNARLGNRIANNGQYYTLYPDNWTDETYRTGFRQEYNLSFSGGSNTYQIFGSLGYLENEGIVKGSDYERFTGRLRASLDVKPWLHFGGNLGYTKSTNSYAEDLGYNGSYYTATGGAFSDAANVAPIYPMYVRDENGNIMYDQRGKMYDWGNGLYNANSNVRPVATNTSSLQSLEIDHYKTVGNNMVADGYMNVDLPYGFIVTVKGGTNVYERRIKSSMNPWYGYEANREGSLNVSHNRTSTFNFQQLINWVKSYGSHNLNVLLGHENYLYKYETLEALKSGAVDYDNVQELNGFLNWSDSPYSYCTDYNTEGWIARAMYDFNDRYFAQASYRRDASSRFHPKHRWGNFWSLGGAWIISREKWFNSNSWVNTLKLKVSYGKVGNDNIGYYRYVDTYQINNVDGALSLGLYAKGNEDITWEKLGNLNAGIEFELFNSRLSGSFEVYNKKTTDMLLWFSAPSAVGYSGYYKNIGDMRNTGLELTLTGYPVRTKDITWSINLNFNYNQQKVTRLPDENKGLTVDGYSGYQSGNYFVGEGLPLYAFYIPVCGPLTEDGQQQWYDENGGLTTSYSNADLKIIKNYQPVKGGFGTSLSFFGFDVNAQFTFGLGGKSYDAEYSLLMTNPVGTAVGFNLHQDLLNAWTPTNTNTDVPRFYYGDQYTGSISDRYLVKSDFLNFQSAQIGYTIPANITRRLQLEKVRVYAAADNIWLWSARKGYDPRLSAGFGSYSPMRTISGGINVVF